MLEKWLLYKLGITYEGCTNCSYLEPIEKKKQSETWEDNLIY